MGKNRPYKGKENIEVGYKTDLNCHEILIKESSLGKALIQGT
jgi:hypothetical protein